MKTAMPLTAAIALLALSACGDDTATNTESPATERRVEVPAKSAVAGLPEQEVEAPGKTAEAIPVGIAGDVVAVVEKAPTPMPEPENPIIAFKSEDGKLALTRDALTMVSPVHDADNDVWSVFVQLDKKAAEDFYTLTTETTGEALSVVVDQMVVSAPVLDTPIYGGGFVFTVDDSEVASTVVAALKGEKPRFAVTDEAAGKLPQDKSAATESAETGEE